MASSKRIRLAVMLVVAGHTSIASAQPQGFAVERLYPSAPGGGWLVMDNLDIPDGLGGDLSFTLGYANNPLRLSDGTTRLAIVSDEVFADVGAALTYDGWRFYLNFDSPVVIRGQSGMIAGNAFTRPSLYLGSNPDEISDFRVGTDMRILGEPGSPFRLGASAQLFVPFGNRNDYDTDGTFRAMLRALVAGDRGLLTYAAQLGVHIRPLDDSPTPGSPEGSEFLFGAAAGVKLPVRCWTAVIGPEVFGATAFRSFFGSDGTAIEGLLSSRLEGPIDEKRSIRIRLGLGGGIHQQFGAAEWRMILGVEIYNRSASRP